MSLDDPELARLEHENMISAEGFLASLSPVSFVTRTDGVALLATGLPVTSLNQVIVESDMATASSLSAAVTSVRQRGLPFIVNLRQGTDDRFVALMSELGLAPVTDGPWVPGMTLNPIPSGPAPVLADYEIVQVSDADGLEDFMQALMAGFQIPEELTRAMLTPSVLQRDEAVFYAGYANGEPVSTGVGLRTGRTIGAYNISTAPAARRRGYGEAMTRRIAADGALAGCDVAALQASRMGFPLYERLGYRTVVQYLAYVEPETPTTT